MMRRFKAVAIIVAVLLSGAATAGLEDTAADGWHTWSIEQEDAGTAHFYVLIENGKPARIHSMSWNCHRPTKSATVDHGIVTATESYDWFLTVIEDGSVEQDIRDAALFGLVESRTDEAIAYIDRILSAR